jgi:hypothetical protein
LNTVLDDTGINWDTRFEKEVKVTSGNLTYIHKYLNGRDIWFFANSSDHAIEVPVILKGEFRLQAWDPHDGSISGCTAAPENRSGEKFTRASLNLGPLKSVFWVDGPKGN